MTITANRRSAVRRDLTQGEIEALSEGLPQALRAAGARPRIISRASPLAHVARLWRGSVPIMVLGQTIWWPDAPDDASTPGREPLMAVLQHELQHVLEFATGQLTVARYVLRPANWRYGYSLERPLEWSALGAEQRAQVVQDYWLAGRGLVADPARLRVYRRLIPWAIDRDEAPAAAKP